MKKQFVFIFLFFSMISLGQNFNKHKWKNRVLLIFSNERNSKETKNQIEILSKDKNGLIERKLIIYRFTKDSFTTDFNSVWFSSTLNIEKYKDSNESFKIFLIGLDSGIKLKQTTTLSTEKLFTIIDGMPMRKSEIRSKN